MYYIWIWKMSKFGILLVFASFQHVKWTFHDKIYIEIANIRDVEWLSAAEFIFAEFTDAKCSYRELKYFTWNGEHRIDE